MTGSGTGIETVPAGNAEIPVLGLGTWQLTGQQCTESVATALDVGYRHLDTAEIYGNEEAIGAGIDRTAVDPAELFITSKVWRSNLDYDGVIGAATGSRNRLGVPTIDFFLVHWPHPRRPIEPTLDAMATLQDDGVIRHSGVANFTRSQLAAARETAPVPLVTDQVLYNPYADQTALLAYCRDNGLALTAYSPLARGRVRDDPELTAIGESHGKSPAQIALRWLVQQRGVVAIPKATSREHLTENRAIFDFELSAEELRRIDEIEPGLRQRLLNFGPALMRRNPLP